LAWRRSECRQTCQATNYLLSRSALIDFSSTLQRAIAIDLQESSNLAIDRLNATQISPRQLDRSNLARLEP
jgi:hypothetical protein